MNEEELKEMYKELKRNKKIIESIDTDFFFEFAGTILNLLEKKDRRLEERTNRIRNLEKECQSNFDNMMDTIQDNSKKDKIIDEIQKEVRDHIGFENRLKRDNKEPDLFNQGRFYVANNINNILKGK